MKELSIEIVSPRLRAILGDVAFVLVGSLVVAAAAQIVIPVWLVPMTLQTLAVLSVGATLGSRLGSMSLILYGFEGAIGLPFFAGGKSGIFDQKLDYLFPSGSMGYVAGFVLAAWLVGRIVETGRPRSLFRSILATGTGALVLYVPGLTWLTIWAHTAQHLDLSASVTSALQWGFYPFVVGDSLKALIAGLSCAALPSMIKPK